ncbi:RDD family protein [Streptosporangium sp. NPDC049046]|uniref:RDD family protein n=1 Tax=Streptosporangium sp. NPDC049046 TaxID=3155031 RepID=UPI003425A94B
MPELSRLSLSVWGAAAVVAALPTWALWRERLASEEFPRSHAGSDLIYGVVGLYESGLTLSPFAPLRHDLEVVIETAEEWAVPALMVLLGLLACLGRRDPGVTARRVAGLLVLIAAVELLAWSHGERGIYSETVSLFGAVGFGAVVGGWWITELCLLAAAALVFAASREMRPLHEMRPVTGNKPGASQAGMVWRRSTAALADYLIVATVLGVVVWPVWSLIGLGSEFRMGYGFLGRVDVLQSSAEPVELAILSVLFLYFWVQHALWGRTLGKRLLGVRVIAASTGGRLGAGRAALRTLVFPLLALVPDIGLSCLLVGGLWMLLDAEGRVLHDRLLDTAVVYDRVRDAQPRRREHGRR